MLCICLAIFSPCSDDFAMPDDCSMPAKDAASMLRIMLMPCSIILESMLLIMSMAPPEPMPGVPGAPGNPPGPPAPMAPIIEDMRSMSAGVILPIMSAAILAISGVMPAIPPPPGMLAVIACNCSGDMLPIISAAILAISGVMAGMGIPPGPAEMADVAFVASAPLPALLPLALGAGKPALAALMGGCMETNLSVMRATSCGSMVFKDWAAALTDSGVSVPAGMPACWAIAASCSDVMLDII
mmetsp:Transcript_22324/g.38177  ORF Transcript_22324/g.38177 Transcript_22324/m.38177 type:complete len:242 (-) Transcript_22324:550-1275(-)